MLRLQLRLGSLTTEYNIALVAERDTQMAQTHRL